MAVVSVHVRMLLIVEVVQDPGRGPELLVASVVGRVGDHAGLDAEDVLAQRLGLRPLAEEAPGLVPIDFAHGPDPNERGAGRPREAAVPHGRRRLTTAGASSAR